MVPLSVTIGLQQLYRKSNLNYITVISADIIVAMDIKNSHKMFVFLIASSIDIA